jgi:hypothetical protein
MPKAQIHCPATSRRVARSESAPLTEEGPVMSLSGGPSTNRDDRLLGVVIVEADGPAAPARLRGFHSSDA